VRKSARSEAVVQGEREKGEKVKRKKSSPKEI